MKTITVYLELSKECKHSKVFKPTENQLKSEVSDEPKALTAIYICNQALEALGNPKKVSVTIEVND